jgi:hypothetical protein
VEGWKDVSHTGSGWKVKWKLGNVGGYHGSAIRELDCDASGSGLGIGDGGIDHEVVAGTAGVCDG